MLIKNIKNLIPYFIIIVIYFFFINLEARKVKINNRFEQENNFPDDRTKVNDYDLRIKIPVVPYK